MLGVGPSFDNLVHTFRGKSIREFDLDFPSYYITLTQFLIIGIKSTSLDFMLKMQCMESRKIHLSFPLQDPENTPGGFAAAPVSRLCM